jgi:hypothetical protein
MKFAPGFAGITFSWHYVHNNGRFTKSSLRPDLVVLIEKKYENDHSYLNEGPAKTVKHYGKLEFVDFDDYDATPLVERLSERRAIFSIETRGRPRKKKQ